MIGLLVSFALLSIAMVLAMVPMSMELMAASATMSEHRRRLRRLGAVGVLSQWLLPRALDQHSPRNLWLVVYSLCWTGLLVFAGLLIATSEPRQRLHNLLVLTVVAGGWWCVHLAIVCLGRALNRTNRSARDRAATATEPADSADDGMQSAAVEEHVTKGQSITSRPATTATTEAGPGACKARGAIASAVCVLGALLLIGIGDGLAQQVQSLQAADQLLNAHQRQLVGLTIGLAALGFVMFMGAVLDLILSRGRPMSRQEIRALRARALVTRAPVLARASTYRSTGEAVGGEAQDQWSLGQMKQAWRTRAWRGSRLWKRRFVVCIGVAMLMLGLFGLVIVIGSWGVKLLVGLMLSYAAIRTAWAVYRAE